MNSRRVNTWSLLFLASLPVGISLVADAAETPSLELLEFLGNWETTDGEWLDPLLLLEEIEAEAETAQIEDQHDE